MSLFRLAELIQYGGCLSFANLYGSEGKLIKTVYEGYATGTEKKIPVDLEGLGLAEGIYFVKCKLGEEVITHKILYQK